MDGILHGTRSIIDGQLEDPFRKVGITPQVDEIEN